MVDVAGDNFMYMLVQPEWLGDLQCDVARHVNPDNVFVHNPYTSPLLKEKQGDYFICNLEALLGDRSSPKLISEVWIMCPICKTYCFSHGAFIGMIC